MGVSTVGAGQDYATLDLWWAAVPGTSWAEDEIAECVGNVYSGSGTDTYASSVQNGFQAIVRPQAGEAWVDATPPVFSTSKARLDNSSSAAFNGFTEVECDMTWDRMQFRSTHDAASNTCVAVNTGNDVYFQSCYFVGSDGSSGGDFRSGILVGSNSAHVVVTNCIFEDFTTSSDPTNGTNCGMSTVSASDKHVIALHCLWRNCGIPMRDNGKTVVRNCIDFETGNSWDDGTSFQDGDSRSNSSDGPDEAGSTDPEINQTFVFEDAAAGDYRHGESRPGYDVDTNSYSLGGGGPTVSLAVDALGVARTEFTRGPFEYVAAPPPSGSALPIMMHML